MTPLELQDLLCEEIKQMLKPHRFKNQFGEDVEMQVFPQHIPINETDDEEDPIPYVIVRLNRGDSPLSRDSANTVDLVIIVGVWDDDLEAQGHRDILNVIQKIYERFASSPTLGGRAVFTGDFHWATQEDNYYPYFFGAARIQFWIGSVRREDELA